MLRGEKIPAAKPRYHIDFNVTAEFLQKAAGKLKTMESLLRETLDTRKKSGSIFTDKQLKEQKGVATAFREQMEYAIEEHRDIKSVFLYTAYDLRLHEKDIVHLETKIKTSDVTARAIDECCSQFLIFCHALEDCTLSIPARLVLTGAIDSIVKLKASTQDDDPDTGDIHMYQEELFLKV